MRSHDRTYYRLLNDRELIEAAREVEAARATLESERQAQLAEVNARLAQARAAAAAEADAAGACEASALEAGASDDPPHAASTRAVTDPVAAIASSRLVRTRFLLFTR